MLDRNRFVIGQIIGADKYDIGHIALGNSGGGVAGLGVVGGANKARGCTGLATPVGDYYRRRLRGARDGSPVQRQPHLQRHAVQLRRQPQRRDLGRAGLGLLDHGLRRHLRPGQPPAALRSVLGPEELRGDPLARHQQPGAPAVSEVQNVALRDFDGTDSFTLTYDGKTVGPFTRGTNYTAAAIQAALQGATEVQTVAPGRL